MQHLKKLLLFFIVTFATSFATATESSFSKGELIEQEYGGEMVTYPEMQVFVRKVAGRKCRILDDSRVAAFSFSNGEMALTRGLLYQLKNEAELKAVVKKAAKMEGEIPFESFENKVSSKEFKEAFRSFFKSKEAYLTLSSGFKACEMGKHEEALCLGEDLLRDLPEEPRLLELLATASDGIGNHTGALLELKYALRLNPNYYGFYLQRGLLFQKLGLPEVGKIDLCESLKLYPTEKASLQLGKISVVLGECDEANSYLDQTTDQNEAPSYRCLSQMMRSISHSVDQFTS